ncbi:hypothetical protein SAMN05444365_11241 [Micromonospora pattaloongensis]|uniref:ARB-07466-like C-terminal domain-containing protein n=1 Tax=Micromonospora pattaloongensis TaxID=405436 RepID=A0A1H3SKX8_9ACTN|nr:hypothetical protein [Micromonospora pattaloongensis]SDZ38225.1 hypothetical protein SAMN05444365_11241 [Micromonospora pattaloongensis]
MTGSVRRRGSLAATLVAVLTLLAGMAVAPSPAAAAPSNPAAPGNEGGTPLLRDVLDKTGRNFVAARNAVDNSRKRQLQLSVELRRVQSRINSLLPEVGHVAANAYRTGRVGPMMLLLNSSGSDDFINRAEGLDMIAMRDNQKLRDLNELREQATRAKAAIDAELAEQKKQYKVMEKQKKDAERALQLVGGKATGGFVSATSPVAKAAPRNPDGSWPGQSCSQADPTTSGCVTPRTLHALKEAQRAGFKRFVGCFRTGDMYEHPKGRACDFSMQNQGFGGAATGNDKLYGNNLAAFFVRNADRLGVLYVIWYRQVWFPATGWSVYTLAGGDPSSDHTNHVHLSMI